MTLKHFPWPKTPRLNVSPIWNGQTFIIGGEANRVIAYGAETSNRSESLTSMHENFVGTDHPIERMSRQWALKSVRLLPSESAMLDVGCSSGFLIDHILTHLPEAQLIAVDYIKGPLEALARRLTNLPIIQFDIRNCPLPEACIDAVTCLNVLEHIDEDEKALSEIFRILKPGGIAHIEVPAGKKLYDTYDEHLMHHRRYAQSDLLKMAHKVGFKVSYTTHLGFLVYPAFWLVKKRSRLLRGLTHEQKVSRVSGQMDKTHKSKLLQFIFKIENNLSTYVKFPFGIRVIAVLKKP